MSDKDSDILRKIKALLAKADSTDSPQEAEAFFTAAQRLMVQHRITESQLNVDPAAIQADEIEFFRNRLEADWETRLAHVIIRTNGCEFVLSKDEQKLKIYGEPNDVALVKYFFETTRDAFRRLSKSEWRKNQRSTAALKNQYIRSFLLGACAGLAENIKRMTAETVQDAQAYGLILTNKVDKARAYVMKEGGVKMSRRSSRGPGSDDAYGDGVKAGKSHQLHRPVGGSHGSPKLLN